MSIETPPYPTGEDNEPDYGLDEERWLSLSVEARVSLAIAGLDTGQESFGSANEITEELVAATGLDRQTVRDTNRFLVQAGFVNRSGFMTDQALRLSLSDKGYRFIEDEIKQAR